MRIRFHSDCDYFAGCENMLANFFNDAELSREHELSFSYRPSREYDEGLGARVPRPPELVPLKVYDFHQLSGLANGWPAPLRILYKSVLRLVLAKHWLFLWNVRELDRALAGRRLDVLHINNGGFPGAQSCLAAAVAGRLQGVRRIVHVVNNLPVPYGGPDRWLDWPLDRLALSCVDVTVTGSEVSRRRLIEVLGLPPEEVLSLPNGIAERRVEESRQALRARLGAGAARPLVAVVAVLEPRKGHRVLLEALAALKSEKPAGFPLTAFGGDGPLRAELEAENRRLGLEKDVLFLGWQKAHFDLFNAADIVALPSTGFEDFPNVTIEAMGLGKAVLATRVGGVPEQLEDGRTGVLVAPGDASALKEALGRLCADAGLRERLGRAAAERFQKVYTAKASVDRYRVLYQSLLPEAA